MTEEHGRGSGPRPDPLTPDDVRAPTHAERARTLAASQRVGTLGTLSRDPAGYPYGSFVTFALNGPNPVFLVSHLATNTKNLEVDPRASLLIAEDETEDPLANARVTLVGECSRLADAAQAREAFLAVHPAASYYVDFSDFGFFELSVDAVRYIGGYGRMSWVELDGWSGASPDPIANDARAIIDHMNGDHAEALALYARAFTAARQVKSVTMTAVDRYGFELGVHTDDGPQPARLAFESEITSATEARQALVALVKKARGSLAD